MATKKPTKKTSRKQENGKVVQLIWDSADDLDVLYANQMLVTHGESEFHLIFGHLNPPMALSPQELPDEAHIKPIANIVVTPKFIRKVINALTKNLERFESKEEKEGKDAS